MNAWVLLHGFSGSPASFDDLTRRLAARIPRRRAFRPALLGHDGSIGRGTRRFEQEIDRLATLIARAGARGAHLCGYSLGARVALGLIARHPHLFGSATLIGVHPGLKSLGERASRVAADERWCERLMSSGVRGFSRAWEAQPIFASQAALPRARLAEQRLVRSRHSAAGLIQSLRVLGLGQMPNYWGVLATLPFEVRLIAGDRDAKFTRIAREAAGRSQRARLEIVEGVGHNVMLEAPERVAELLTRAVS